MLWGWGTKAGISFLTGEGKSSLMGTRPDKVDYFLHNGLLVTQIRATYRHLMVRAVKANDPMDASIYILTLSNVDDRYSSPIWIINQERLYFNEACKAAGEPPLTFIRKIKDIDANEVQDFAITRQSIVFLRKDKPSIKRSIIPSRQDVDGMVITW